MLSALLANNITEKHRVFLQRLSFKSAECSKSEFILN